MKVWTIIFLGQLQIYQTGFFINLLIAGLTQGKWPFDFVILDRINVLIASLMESAIMDQLSSTDLSSGPDTR